MLPEEVVDPCVARTARAAELYPCVARTRTATSPVANASALAPELSVTVMSVSASRNLPDLSLRTGESETHVA